MIVLSILEGVPNAAIPHKRLKRDYTFENISSWDPCGAFHIKCILGRKSILHVVLMVEVNYLV
jgi:hypothetical protein